MCVCVAGAGGVGQHEKKCRGNCVNISLLISE